MELVLQVEEEGKMGFQRAFLFALLPILLSVNIEQENKRGKANEQSWN